MTKAIRWTPEMLKAHQERTAKTIDGIVREAKTGQQRMQALGRLRDGQMNKTEQHFADYLDAEKAAGRVLWWAFEGIKFKLAKNTHLTVDFAVMVEGGQLHMIDVKGARAIYSDDAKAKMKIAADKFPLAFFVAFPTKGGGWDIEEVK